MRGCGYGLAAICWSSIVLAQIPPGVEAERQQFARWLETAPTSPGAAIFHQPVDNEIRFGPDGTPGLGELPAAVLRGTRSGFVLESADGTRRLPRHRAVQWHGYYLRVSGDRSRPTLTVYGPLGDVHAPGWYAYDPEAAVVGTLEPPASRQRRRMLGLDGLEVEGTLAGTFVAEMHGQPIRLLVYRMPEPGSEEADLQIFFRDETNGRGTYPAGRFLALVPLGGDRYRADFNRARNPFCAYNGVFPCPLPWRGNQLTFAVEAGERYYGEEIEQ